MLHYHQEILLVRIAICKSKMNREAPGTTREHLRETLIFLHEELEAVKTLTNNL